MVHIPNIHDSKWIFIAGSETRFVFDVVNAANIVQQKQGNCVNNIYFLQIVVMRLQYYRRMIFRVVSFLVSMLLLDKSNYLMMFHLYIVRFLLMEI